MSDERLGRMIIISLLLLPVMLSLLMKQRFAAIRETVGLSISDNAKGRIGVSVNSKFYGVYYYDANAVTDIAKLLARGALDIDTNKHLLSEYIVKATPGSQLNIISDNRGNMRVEVDRLPANALYMLGLAFDINKSSAVDLELLPGIGPGLAERIIEYRQNNGGKMRVDELINVNGIGAKKFKALRRFFL